MAGELDAGSELDEELGRLFVAYRDWLRSPVTLMIQADAREQATANALLSLRSKHHPETRDRADADYAIYQGISEGRWFRMAHERAVQRMRARFAAADDARDAENEAVQRADSSRGTPRKQSRL